MSKKRELKPKPASSGDAGERKANVTIRQVAERAGVSRKTVSRVINQEPYVSEATLKKVQEAVAELKFVPNVRAQRLRHGRSCMIAAAYSKGPSTGTWYLDVLQTAVTKATEFGYELVLHPCFLMLAEEQQRTLRLVEQGTVDGLLLLPPYGGRSKFTDTLVRHGVPFVQIEPPSVDKGSVSISVTNKQGAVDMTEYLISIGHRAIGFIKGSTFTRVSEERLVGYREALERHGIPFDPDRVMQGDFSFESGIVNGRLLLKQRPRPTAIFASNDEMAAGALQAAYQSGLTVPDDVSVAGYEDYSWARRLSPPLTTVQGQITETVSMATELLIRLINGETIAEPLYREVATTLVVRESTGPPR